jgi:hypothetical protein
VLEQVVDLGRVDVKPGDVGESHLTGGKDGLEVVEGELQLRGHVARMLRLTVGADRVLSATNELPPVPLDHLGLVESQPQRPRPNGRGRRRLLES